METPDDQATPSVVYSAISEQRNITSFLALWLELGFNTLVEGVGTTYKGCFIVQYTLRSTALRTKDDRLFSIDKGPESKMAGWTLS
jgi:hypothetical protein